MINDTFKHRVIYKPTIVIDIRRRGKSFRDFEGILYRISSVIYVLTRNIYLYISIHGYRDAFDVLCEQNFIFEQIKA